MRWLSKLSPGILLAGAGLLFTWYQAIPRLPDPDSFYHARFVALMLQHGVITHFPWLPLTTLGDSFADHHLLYHLSLLPAVYWLGPLVGVKVMQALYAVALVMLCYGVLRRWQIPYAALAVPLLFSCYPMLVRMNLVKASALAVMLFIIVFVALVERRYAVAGIMTIIYSLAHGGFFLAIAVAIIVWIAECLASLQQRSQPFIPPLPTGVLAVVLGAVLGIIFNPYFPSNLPFLWTQFFQIGVVNYRSTIEVGAEWYPFALPDLISASSLLLIGLVPMLALFITQFRRLTQQVTIISLVLMLPVFFALTLRSRRFIEYFVPVLWLAICVVVLPAIQQGIVRRWWRIMTQPLGKWALVLNIYLVAAIGFGVVMIYATLPRDFWDKPPLDRYASAGAYLRSVSQPDEIVFHGQWDDFPELFYYNDQAAYVVGLDATFLYLADATLYQQWRDIATGQAKQQTVQHIREQFHSRYVVIDDMDESTKLMLAYLLRDRTVQVAFHQNHIWIFSLYTA